MSAARGFSLRYMSLERSRKDLSEGITTIKSRSLVSPYSPLEAEPKKSIFSAPFWINAVVSLFSSLLRVLALEALLCLRISLREGMTFYTVLAISAFLIFAWAAARRAMGTRKGEQLT